MWISERPPEKYVNQRDRTTCLKIVHHSRIKSQHNWGDLYDHLINSRIHFYNEKDNHMSSETYEDNGFSHDMHLAIMSH